MTGQNLPRIVALGWLMLQLSGCGGGGSDAPVTSAPPPPPMMKPQLELADAPQTAPKPAEKIQPVAAKPKKRDPRQDDPRKPFLLGVESPNFSVVPAAHRADEGVYAVTPPLAAVSNQFQVVAPPVPKAAPTVGVAPLPAGFTALPQAGVSSDGHPLRIRCDVDGATMAYVPPGVVKQGIDGAGPEAGPAHAVFVDGFYMDVHEVTVSQYQTFRKTAEGKRAAAAVNESGSPNAPAVGIAWGNAQLYMRWTGKTFPTEAEWELAARSEASFLYPWGNGRAIWSHPRAPGQIDPVGSFVHDRSLAGIEDLAGNAREWCSDWYGADYYQSVRAGDGAPVRNPTGPGRSSVPNARVAKGAGPGSPGWELWRRSAVPMSDTAPDVGIRCVLRLTSAPAPGPKARTNP